MQTRFLLGPAGSGKTFRCLTEIRHSLAFPEGAPLVLIAPKQATFQLERQLLNDKALLGYTRLQILSFERLAEFVLEKLRKTPVRMLEEEGRVMVLRALLEQKKSQLKLFYRSARWPGFVQQLSRLLREFQHHHLSPERLAVLERPLNPVHQLNAKLRDIALLFQAYLDWLKEHQLEDADSLLALATEALGSSEEIKLGGLWLDGFAEMTPRELDLLAAVARCSEQTTLAFCLEKAPEGTPAWLSIWSLISETYRQCFSRITALPDCDVKVEILERDPARTRFLGNPVLQHLEKYWTRPSPFVAEPATSLRDNRGNSRQEIGLEPAKVCSDIQAALRIAKCVNPEAEAILASREILEFVRAGGRFREAAVLVRH